MSGFLRRATHGSRPPSGCLRKPGESSILRETVTRAGGLDLTLSRRRRVLKFHDLSKHVLTVVFLDPQTRCWIEVWRSAVSRMPSLNLLLVLFVYVVRSAQSSCVSNMTSMRISRLLQYRSQVNLHLVVLLELILPNH